MTFPPPVPPGPPYRHGDITPRPVQPNPYQPYQAPPPPYQAPPPPHQAPPPQYPPQPYGQPHIQPYIRPATYRDGFAIAGFVLSLVGAVLISVIFCILALTRISKSRAKGTNLAIAGLVLSGVWVLLLIGLAVNGVFYANTWTTNASSADDLRVGDCVAGEPDWTTGVDVVPCGKAHTYEAYYSFQVPDAGFWPGEDAVLATARATCREQLPDRLGGLDVTFLYPREAAWQQGVREVMCLASPPGTTEEPLNV